MFPPPPPSPQLVFHDVHHVLPKHSNGELIVSPVLQTPPPITLDATPSPASSYYYVDRPTSKFGSPSSPSEMYDSDPPSSIYHQEFSSVSNIRDSISSYPSDSPSPRDHFPSSDFTSFADSYPSYLDHRRMSEPAVLAVPNAYSAASQDPYTMPFNNSSARSAYTPTLHRGASIGSLRDLRHHHHNQQQQQSQQHLHSRSQSAWKSPDESLDSPISPYQPNFSGSALAGSPTMAHGIQYSPIPEDHYGPSPPGTGTSTSSNPQGTARHSDPQQTDTPGLIPSDITSESNDPNSKTYSFVALPGNAVKKRPRRRYDEIERLYQCSWPDCNKAYGTLNHLNAHVTMQKHGAKRSPNEFKELRKQWRKAKKESEAAMVGGVPPRRIGQQAEEHDLYDSNSGRYSSSHQRFPYSSSSAMAIPTLPPRYDEIGYPGDDRGGVLSYGSMPSRQRYDTTPSSHWNHGAFSSSARSNVPSTGYISSSLPSASFHHNNHNHHASAHSQSHSLHQLQLEAPSSYSAQSTDRPPLTIPSPPQMLSGHGRLGPDSMLLTPLTGYEHPRETLPTAFQANDGMTYDSEAYYEGESGRRSGSTHAS